MFLRDDLTVGGPVVSPIKLKISINFDSAAAQAHFLEKSECPTRHIIILEIDHAHLLVITVVNAGISRAAVVYLRAHRDLIEVTEILQLD